MVISSCYLARDDHIIYVDLSEHNPELVRNEEGLEDDTSVRFIHGMHSANFTFHWPQKKSQMVAENLVKYLVFLYVSLAARVLAKLRVTTGSSKCSGGRNEKHWLLVSARGFNSLCSIYSNPPPKL